MVSPMSLTLVTGPANAAKAGFVLSGFREALERSSAGTRLAPAEPLLVVPTAADVEPYQRELAAAGVVFGGEVVTFVGLVRQIAAGTGYPGRPLGPVARERLVSAVVRSASLQALEASAAMPGFPAAAGRLFAELQRCLVTPARFRSALRTWGGGGAAAEEMGGLYAAYLDRLERLGRVDAEGWVWGAVDALRANPPAWGGRPVFLYGFDDLTPAEADAIETLARAADVTVSLPYEAGRPAFAGRAATVEALRPVSDRVVELPDRAEHYAPSSRSALHHLERRLFDDRVEPVDPGGAVRLLEAGGERAEAELAGSAILDLLRAGAVPSEIAVLVRDPGEASLLEQVLDGYGIPVERTGRTPLARTRLGAGLLAFARAALPDGAPEDLLAWLRTPGKAPAAEVDELEARVRRFEPATAAAARRHWPGRPLTELDALAGASTGTDPRPLLDVLEAELESIWTAPWRRAGTVLGAHGEGDAAVAAAVRAACGELRSLAAADPRAVGSSGGVLEALAEVAVDVPGGTPGGVLLADPLSVRARRFRAVLVCGLQDGAFPRRPSPDPFLDDDDRRALAAASGLVLPLHEDVLARERYLFYASVSRAEEVLHLAFRTSDEEGEPQVPSPFVADVRRLFTDALWEGRARRLLAEVTWTPAQAPTEHELRRALAARRPAADPPALAPPVAAPVRALLAERECEPARGLETFAACGVRWLVESVLRPRRLDPDPDAMRRGAVAHRVLQRTLSLLRERGGSARLSPATRERAAAALADALGEERDPRGGARAEAALRALEADLRRWLDAECAADTGLEPEHLEWSFGTRDDGPPALELAGDVRVSGRVDRIDVGPGAVAVVRDYKNSAAPPGAKWTDEKRLQAGLYALAARELLGLRPAAAVYQPLSGPDLRARGIVAAGRSDTEPFVSTDVLDEGEFDALLDEVGGLAVEAARGLRDGRIAPCPERCTPRGCAHPAICRAAEPSAVGP